MITTASKLAQNAALSQSRLTHRLRTLIDRGDVAIEPDPNDRRSKWATLTTSGKKRIECAAPSHGATVRRVILDHLTPEQAEAIGKALKPVVDALNEHPEYLDPNS